MSAVVGFIETAPIDQFEAPLKVSEMGTLGAPALVLPLARGSRLPLTPLVAFHCETCGAGTVIVRFPPIASVSNTIPFTTLGTSNCELNAAAPSAEIKVLTGTV
jgi:hypothetical protein